MSTMPPYSVVKILDRTPLVFERCKPKNIKISFYSKITKKIKESPWNEYTWQQRYQYRSSLSTWFR